MKCAEYVEWILGYEVVWIFLDLANPTLFGNFEFVFEFSLVGWVERINRIAPLLPFALNIIYARYTLCAAKPNLQEVNLL